MDNDQFRVQKGTITIHKLNLLTTLIEQDSSYNPATTTGILK
ncbi:hypothetical protein LINGRAHAP2_LOCUS22385 [Linum grandiflorum]